MKIGLSSKAFPVNMSIPQGLRLTKGSSFDSVELDISEAGYLTMESDEKAIAFLRGAVENISLKVGSVRADVLEGVSDSEYAGALVRCVEICAALGGDVLSVPGRQGVAGGSDLAGAAKTAEAQGVVLAFECAGCGVLASAEEARALVESAGGEAVGVCVDTACVSPEAWIRELGDRVKLVRVRDVRRCECGDVVRLNILEGDVDWKEVRKALLEVGYDGQVIAQGPGYRQYAELGIKHCGECMKRVFGAKGRD